MPAFVLTPVPGKVFYFSVLYATTAAWLVITLVPPQLKLSRHSLQSIPVTVLIHLQ